MGFQGSRLVFHGSRSVFMPFHGSRLFFFIFHVENTLKLYSGLMIQSRPCWPKAGFGLVPTKSLSHNFWDTLYDSLYYYFIFNLICLPSSACSSNYHFKIILFCFTFFGMLAPFAPPPIERLDRGFRSCKKEILVFVSDSFST